MKRHQFYGYKPCKICGTTFQAAREHAKTCSPKCRKALERQNKLIEKIQNNLAPPLPPLPRGVEAGSLAAQVFSGMIVNAIDNPPGLYEKGAIDEQGNYEPPQPRKKKVKEKKQVGKVKKAHKAPQKAIKPAKRTRPAKRPAETTKPRKKAKITR